MSYFGKINEIPGVYYVAASYDVSGIRDGSQSAPYADLSFMSTEPTTQAEYELSKRVVILDSGTYALPSTVAMGIWSIQLNSGFLEDAVGGTTWEIDSGLRFGSSDSPTFYVIKDLGVITTAWTGDGFTAALKSGGSAVSVLRTAISGLLRSGDITIADGTNGGTSCATIPVFSMFRATIDASGTFKGRLALVSLTEASLSSTGTGLEVGYFTSITNSTISATGVLESRASTTTKFIRGLKLNSSGGVSWDTSTRNWNVDTDSATEILNKITTYPTSPLTLSLVTAESVGYDNTTSGLTAENVQDAIDELAASSGGDYLPLAGGTMEGDVTLDTGVQILGDASSTSSPTYSFDGYDDTGVSRQTISSANRLVMVADGVNTVEYGASGTVTRVPFLFAKQDVAWGSSTVDGGIKNVFESAIGEDVTRMWGNKDFNAIVLCDFGDRDRTTFNNVWTNDGQPVILFWGSQQPSAANYEHYMAVGTSHSAGYSRIDTGNGWDLHFRQGRDVIFYSKANGANIAAARDDYFERAEGVVDSAIIFTDSASTTAVNVKLTQNHHWWDSSSSNIIYTLPDLKNVPIGWRIRFSDYRGTCSTNAVRIAGFSTQVIYSGILSIAGSNTYDITTKYRGLELQNIDGKAWYVICVS